MNGYCNASVTINIFVNMFRVTTLVRMLENVVLEVHRSTRWMKAIIGLINYIVAVISGNDEMTLHRALHNSIWKPVSECGSENWLPKGKVNERAEAVARPHALAGGAFPFLTRPERVFVSYTASHMQQIRTSTPLAIK